MNEFMREKCLWVIFLNIPPCFLSVGSSLRPHHRWDLCTSQVILWVCSFSSTHVRKTPRSCKRPLHFPCGASKRHGFKTSENLLNCTFYSVYLWSSVERFRYLFSADGVGLWGSKFTNHNFTCETKAARLRQFETEFVSFGFIYSSDLLSVKPH